MWCEFRDIFTQHWLICHSKKLLAETYCSSVLRSSWMFVNTFSSDFGTWLLGFFHSDRQDWLRPNAQYQCFTNVTSLHLYGISLGCHKCIITFLKYESLHAFWEVCCSCRHHKMNIYYYTMYQMITHMQFSIVFQISQYD